MGNGTMASVLVLMGVSGSGKTCIGQTLAKHTGATFADADDYHPEANKAKMAAGIPLTDEDRAPWLATLNELLRGWIQSGTKGILACSALKEAYRQTLTGGVPAKAIAFVWLDPPRALLEQRVAARHHEYMNPNLLGSQLATLEPPTDALRVANDKTPDEVAQGIVDGLAKRVGS